MSADILSRFKDFVGLNDPEDVYEEEEEFQQQPRQTEAKPGPRVHQPAAPIAAAPTQRGNIIGLPANPASEVVVIEPRSFDEALAILDNLRSRKAVILNLMGLAPEQSQRLVDFVSGACHALDGHQEKIGESIFLFTPSNVVINSFHSERDWMGAQQPKDLFWRVR
ncbi:MAG: cell division protein SepF [Candidatus Sericytochromatia bacterium]